MSLSATLTSTLLLLNEAAHADKRGDRAEVVEILTEVENTMVTAGFIPDQEAASRVGDTASSAGTPAAVSAQLGRMKNLLGRAKEAQLRVENAQSSGSAPEQDDIDEVSDCGAWVVVMAQPTAQHAAQL